MHEFLFCRRSSGESGGRLSRLSSSPEPAVHSRLPKKAKPEKKKIKKEILSLELVSSLLISVVDPYPDWIRIQWGSLDPDLDPGEQK
jgi:hypothetical protein